MIKFVFAVILLGSSAAIAQSSARLPTKDELAQSFKKSAAQTLAHAKEYSDGDPKRLAYFIKYDTMNSQQLDELADYVEKNLQRQVVICEGLKKQFPHAKNADCVKAVLMVNGLGHPEDQRALKESLANKETAKQLATRLNSQTTLFQLKTDTTILQKGDGGRLDGARLSDGTIESAIGFISSIDQFKELIAAALAAH